MREENWEQLLPDVPGGGSDEEGRRRHLCLTRLVCRLETTVGDPLLYTTRRGSIGRGSSFLTAVAANKEISAPTDGGGRAERLFSFGGGLPMLHPPNQQDSIDAHVKGCCSIL